jgi:hypothetical protein
MNSLLQDLAIPTTIMLVAALLALILGLVQAVQAVTGGRPWAPLSGLVVVPVLATATVAGWFERPESSPEAALRALHLGTAPLMLAPFFLLAPVLLPSLFLAIAAVIRGPRSWLGPALVAIPGVVAVVLPAWGTAAVGQGLEDLGQARSVLYGVALVPLFIASFAGDPQSGSGPSASAVVAVLYAGLVGAGEAAGRSLFWFLLLGPFAATIPEHRLELIDRVSRDLLAPAAPYEVATLVAGGCAALMALVPAIRAGGQGRGLGLAAVPVVLLSALPWVLGGVPRTTWEIAAVAIPHQPAPVSPLPGAPLETPAAP